MSSSLQLTAALGLQGESGWWKSTKSNAMVMKSLKTLENTVGFSQASVTYSYSDFFLRRGLENYRWVCGYLVQAGLDLTM